MVSKKIFYEKLLNAILFCGASLIILWWIDWISLSTFVKINLLLYVSVILTIISSKGYITLHIMPFRNKQGNLPSAFIPLLLTSGFLFWGTSKYNFYQDFPLRLWLPSLICTVCLFAYLWYYNGDNLIILDEDEDIEDFKPLNKTEKLQVYVFSYLIVSAAIFMSINLFLQHVNCIFDDTEDIYITDIIDKQIIEHDNDQDDHIMYMSGWQDFQGEVSQDITYGTYLKIEKGDMILITHKEGFLSVPWYEINPKK